MKKITVYSKKWGNQISLVDDEDFEIVNKYRWSVNKSYKKGKFYAKSNTFGILIMMHRLLLDFPPIGIDHVNNDGLDNRRKNLRLATNSQNGMNRVSLNKNNTSGFKGVYWFKGKWRVQLMISRNYICGGRFENIVDAAKSYNKLAIKYHGKFARLNPIP